MFGMSRPLAILVSLFVFATFVLPLAPPVRAADVSVNIYALNNQWHVGTPTSTQTTITVRANDTLRLRIENQDSLDHTFTAPHFPAVTGQGGGGNTLNINLIPGQIFFWNYTMGTDDVESWQFYCDVPGHSTGTYPNRSGMVGLIVVQAVAPPASGDNTLLIVGGIVVVVAVVAAAAFMMRKKPKPPAQPPSQL